MDVSLDRALVRTILGHAEDYPWKMQEIGLLGLWLDDARCYRLHVWDPDSCVDEPVVHDHPFDFTSRVIAGEVTNTRYETNPAGDEYHRVRYTLGREDDRRTDTVRLTGTSSTLSVGDIYSQSASDLHDSRQLPGSVTIIRMGPRSAAAELTTCSRFEQPWSSGQARAATHDEIKRVTHLALEWFAV